jgi:hypothetical protein
VWNTPDGERILTGAEAKAFLYGLEDAVAAIEGAIGEGVPERFGVGIFHDLTCEQKLVVLSEAAEALLRADVLPSRLTALNEGAIAAVYVALSSMVDDFEVAAEGALDAIAEATDQSDETESCAPNGDEMPDWKEWDEDFLYGSSGALPEPSHALRHALGIADGYYRPEVPEVSPADLQRARSVIEGLSRSPNE